MTHTPSAPDGGFWGWMAVIGCFMGNVIGDGVMYRWASAVTYLSIYLSIYISVCLSIYLPLGCWGCAKITVYASIPRRICGSIIRMSVYLSIYLFLGWWGCEKITVYASIPRRMCGSMVGTEQTVSNLQVSYNYIELLRFLNYDENERIDFRYKCKE